jgi:hypothetical protein
MSLTPPRPRPWATRLMRQLSNRAHWLARPKLTAPSHSRARRALQAHLQPSLSPPPPRSRVPTTTASMSTSPPAQARQPALPHLLAPLRPMPLGLAARAWLPAPLSAHLVSWVSLLLSSLKFDGIMDIAGFLGRKIDADTCHLLVAD